jgi:ATP-dependent protease HslVU (ClpYQ) peptidase subunit
MSVVIAIKDGDRILVGCDSQVTLGYTKSTLKSQMKIWKPEDDKQIVMGVVGAFRDANILSTAKEWIEELPKLKNEINFKYIVRNITPKIFRELNNYGRMKTKDGLQYIESNVLFAYKDKAYQIEGDGCVMEIDDILANGSGYRLCLGAWNSLKDKDIPVKEKLIQVIKAACESDLYVNYPIIIMNTKDDEVEIIEK